MFIVKLLCVPIECQLAQLMTETEISQESKMD